MSDFSYRLKIARIDAGLTQDELAKKLDVSKSTISMWENGNRIPSIEIIFPLSKVLHKSPGYFAGDSVILSPSGKATPGPSNCEQDFITDPLTTDEQHLLSVYRDLNETGQDRLIDYADDLQASGRYKKCGPLSKEA